MDYQVSRATVAKLVAYPFQGLDEVAGIGLRGRPRSLATVAATIVNVAVTRQWAVDVLGDPSVSARMRELNTKTISGLVDAVVDPDTGAVLPEVPEGMPPGTHWEWTGAGWILVLPTDIKPKPEPEPQPDWSAEDQIAAGVLLLQAAEQTPGDLLKDVLMPAGQRLIDVGLSRLG